MILTDGVLRLGGFDFVIRAATIAFEENKAIIGPNHIKLDRFWPLEDSNSLSVHRIAVKPFYAKAVFKVL